MCWQIGVCAQKEDTVLEIHYKLKHLSFQKKQTNTFLNKKTKRREKFECR